ncbi:MAG: RNA-binding S4 domain-containing protein [Alphaproteobacteria bacterium]
MGRNQPDTLIEAQRLDKWLWHARFVRTRGAATALVEKVRFRLNGRSGIKPAHKVRVGDVLTFPLGNTMRIVHILALAEKRGGAPFAQTLYEEPSVDDESEALEGD